MHDRAEFVGPKIVAVGHVLVEVVLHRWVDVGKQDLHESVSILPALLMPQAHGVADFVDGIARSAAAPQCDVLPTPAAPDLR